MVERKGDWFQTISGRQFWPLDPSADEVDTLDIAWGLAHSCRYNGHCFRFYSIAQHSVLVARLVDTQDNEVRFAALMHDAAEAYVGDMIRPLKLDMPEYKRVEKLVEEVIEQHYDILIGVAERKLIKQADTLALGLERTVLVRKRARWHTDDLVEAYPQAEAFKQTFTAWPDHYALDAFLSTFRFCMQTRKRLQPSSAKACDRHLALASEAALADLKGGNPMCRTV
jgi:5'-deoxynucleotidase YfbR-like HD superfamily hydrolase